VGKSVVITGGSRGLGLALAQELFARGAQVALLARDADELERARRHLSQEENPRVLTLVCDVTRSQDLLEAYDVTEAVFGRIDILINNAGAISAGPFETMEQEDFEAQMDLHFSAVVQAVRLALPFFHKNGEGRIVNISSIGGKVPLPHMAPYSASKFALSGFSRAVTAELAQKGILVTTVYPGLMRTGSPIQAVFKGDQEKEYAWFAAFDLLPGLSMEASRAARGILRGVSEGRTHLVLSLPAKVGAWVSDNLPETAAAIAGLMTSLLPKGDSAQRRTGAESRAWFEAQPWARPLVAIGHSAEREWNQSAKRDADFNLGVKPFAETP
jgi:short-subunit dehydrogenase